MRRHSDAIRGLRWGAMAMTIALAAIAVVRLTGQAPVAVASEEPREGQGIEEQGMELLAGPGAPREIARAMAPPEVPPPPPLKDYKPRVVRRVAAYVPPPEPEPIPTPELRAPIILGLDDADYGVAPEPVQTASLSMSVPEPPPARPVIINRAKLQRRDPAAKRFMKSMSRAFGFGD